MLKTTNLVLLFCFFSLVGGAQGIPGAPPAKDKDKEFKRVVDPALKGFKRKRPMEGWILAAKKRSGFRRALFARTHSRGQLSEIWVLGTYKVEPDAVFLQLASLDSLGKPFQNASASKDIHNLFKMGLFEDVRVERKVGKNSSIVLVYHLKEKPTLYEIRFEGNSALSEVDLTDAIDLAPYQVADTRRLILNQENIKKKYEEKGYFLADVTYSLQKTTAKDFIGKGSQSVPFVDAVYKIVENKRVKVESVRFIGNKKVSSDGLRNKIQTRAIHPLGLMSNLGTYNKDTFEIDLLIIERTYREKGFLDFKVLAPRLTISADKERLGIVIPVNEGVSYQLGNVKFAGDLLLDTDDEVADFLLGNPGTIRFSKESLEKHFSFSKGDVFNEVKLAQNMMAMTEEYRDEGYAYANLSPIPQKRAGTNIVDLDIRIDSGDQVAIERIDIEGNAKTADWVIRREMRLYEGELYSSTMHRLSEHRIRQLGYFDEVKIIDKPGSAPNLMVLSVSVTERSTGQIQFGGGFATGGERFFFSAKVAQNNLFGRGQTLTLSAHLSGKRRVFDLRFVDPYSFYVGSQPMTLVVSAFNNFMELGTTTQGRFSRASTGGELTFGYPIGAFFSGVSKKWLKSATPFWEQYVPDFENLRLFMSYGAERVQVSDENLGIELHALMPNRPIYSTSLKLMTQLDQRNNRLLTSAGYFLQYRAELAFPVFGSSLLSFAENSIKDKDGSSAAITTAYTRHHINARAYYNFDKWFLWKNWVLKFNLTMGFLDAFGKDLIYENYRLGGLSSLRGYYFNTISPIRRVSSLNPNQPLHEFRIGGNKQIIGNLELEFPLIPVLALKGVLFLDFGNVFATDENLFYLGNKSKKENAGAVFDPVRDLPLGLYSSFGFGFRWLLPGMGLIRFEFGFPMPHLRRPVGTPGLREGDAPFVFQFGVGPSF